MNSEQKYAISTKVARLADDYITACVDDTRSSGAFCTAAGILFALRTMGEEITWDVGISRALAAAKPEYVHIVRGFDQHVKSFAKSMEEKQ